MPSSKTTSYVLALVAAAAAGPSCGGDDAPPGAVAVTRFEADPARVMRGEVTTLRWEVDNAQTLRIVDARGQVLIDQDPAEVSGEVGTAALQSDTEFTIEVQGLGVDDFARSTLEVDVLVPPPVFIETGVAPSQLLAGQAAALSWRAENALAVDIRTSTGAVVLEAGPNEGQAVVRPRVSTTYELTARGIEADAMAMLVVRVGNRPPSIERFIATPPSTTPSRPVALTWQVVGADEIRIRGAGTSTTVYAGPLARGSRTIRIQQSEDFVLTAAGPGGTRSATVAVTIRPPEAVAIERFAVEPNPAARGETPEVTWAVRGADRITIRQDGQLLQSTGQRSGRLPLTIAGDVSRLTVTATGAAGSVAGSVDAFVHDPPVIQRFSVEPRAFAANAPYVVRWQVENATQLRLRRGDLDVPSFVALTATVGPQQNLQGALTLTSSITSVLTLEAASVAGAVSQTALAVVGRAEVEPNDTVAEAGPAAPSGATVDYLGDALLTDVDVFAIVVPAGGSVAAVTSSGPGACDVDTRLRLLRGTEVLATDDDGGLGPCAAITPANAPGAAILPAGTYFVEVRNITGGPYVLTLGPGIQQCGNGAREVPEQCDDGDRAGGDGCSAVCALETTGPVLTGPSGEVGVGVVTSSVRRVVRLDIARAGQSITATAASADGTCNVVDTRLELLDGVGLPLVAAAAGGPTGSAGTCGAVSPQVDRGARDLRPGRYHLRVTGENAVSGPVTLAYAIVDPACGNGLVEARTGEQCDDGNVVSGDGCSSTCIFEGGAAPESEPNDRQADATPSGLVGVGRVQLRGEIRPSGDDDVWSLEVPAGRTLRLSARTYTLRGQPTSCDRTITDTRMFVERAGSEATSPGSGEIAFNDDIDPAQNVWCSGLDRIPLSGGTAGQTFFVRLQGWQDRGTATWFLDLRLDP